MKKQKGWAKPADLKPPELKPAVAALKAATLPALPADMLKSLDGTIAGLEGDADNLNRVIEFLKAVRRIRLEAPLQFR